MKHYLILLQSSRIPGMPGYGFHYEKDLPGAEIPHLPAQLGKLDACKKTLEKNGWQVFPVTDKRKEYGYVGAELAELGRMDLAKLTWIYFDIDGKAQQMRSLTAEVY